MPAPRRHDFIYLASQSPRRRELLDQIGVVYEPLLPDSSEDAEALEASRPGELPAAYVQRVARLKLDAALQRARLRGLQPAPILAADTTVAVGRCILGKPVDAQQARCMLTMLSGRTHRVLTALVLHDERRAMAALNVSWVRFATLPPAVIDRYVRGGEPFDKAGAYAIQGALAGWIERIEGSHSGIMGLPLFETARLLRRAGVSMALAPGSNTL